MTSLLTNNSAIAALQTLRTIGAYIRESQSQASSGLRVANASDNAAYWAISMTMRSDLGSLSAVQDALGLGAAKVDVGYAGLSDVINALSEFKMKLVTASEPSADRRKIQGDLENLKGHIVSIARSASFGGQNWLDTDIANIYDTDLTSETIVTSLSREDTGHISVEKTTVNLAKFSLFNRAGGGILQVDDRSPGTVGGLRNTIYAGSSAGIGSSTGLLTFAPLTFTDDNDIISFTLTVDSDNPSTTTSPQNGLTRTYTINRSLINSVERSWDGVVSTRDQWLQIINHVLQGVGSGSGMSGKTNVYSIASSENAARGSSIFLNEVSSTLAQGASGGLSNMAAVSYGTRAKTYSLWDKPFEIKSSVDVYINIKENGIDKKITLTRETIMAALSSTNGEVRSKQDFIAVMNYAFERNGVAIIASDIGGSHVQYDLDEAKHKNAGSKTSIGITDASDNVGNAPEFGLLDIDVTTNNKIDDYVRGLEVMIAKVVSGASSLGALKARIDTQTKFTAKIMSYISKGLGRLVDADMAEISTRVKALQAQEQLAIQSLQIANSKSQNILRLFQ